jgi:hypothetical protein
VERTSTAIVQRGNDIVVDVQTLGDRFMLKADKNPAVLEGNSGSYRLLAPANGGGFLLRKGSKYRIELWGGSTIFNQTVRDLLVRQLG